MGSVSEIKNVEYFGQFDADAAMGDGHDNIIGLGAEKKEGGLGGGGHGMLLNDVQIRQDEIMLGDLRGVFRREDQFVGFEEGECEL